MGFNLRGSELVYSKERMRMRVRGNGAQEAPEDIGILVRLDPLRSLARSLFLLFFSIALNNQELTLNLAWSLRD